MHLEYNDKIIYMKECIQKKNKLRTLIKQTEQDLIREKLHLNHLLEEHSKKYKKVLSLNIDGINKLFFTILNNKEDQVEIEIQESLKVKLIYDECRHNVDYLVEESKKLVDELSNTVNCEEKEYEGLIDKKIEKTSICDTETCEKLKRLIIRRDNISSNIREADEAIEVGEKALSMVEKTIKVLENVEDWGNWDKEDQLTLAEYTSIDKAVSNAEEAQRLLGKFKREIADINMITNKEISVGYFEIFSSKFYDALIYDFVVLSEIGRTLDIVKYTKNYIDKAMSILYEEKITYEFLYNQMQEQINNLIKSA